MPNIVHDDFEGYAIGQQLPFGGWTANGAVFIDRIVQEGVRGSKAFKLFGQAAWSNNALQTSFTLRLEYYTGGSALPLQLFNGSHYAFEVDLNVDGSITIPQIGGAGATSTTPPNFSFPDWNSIQLNVTVTAGATTMLVNCSAAINGESVLSGGFDTGILLTSIPGGIGIDRFIVGSRALSPVWIDEFTIDTPRQAIPFESFPGSPKIRISQAVIEPVEIPDTAKVRVSQGVIEPVLIPDNAKIRISQAVIEIIMILVPGWSVHES